MAGTSVCFVGYTTVEGHTTYIIKVSNAEGDTWNIQKRYREIRELHDELRQRHGDTLPPFPGKRLFGNQDPAFIASRQVGLQAYLEGVLQMERENRTPALQQFLGSGPQQHAERNEEKEYQKILDNMQSKLLNLALPPNPLDDTEMELRKKKYGNAMRLHVLSQPVDPIHLRAPAFDREPLHLCATNAEQLESLKAPPATNDGKILNDLLDNLQKVVRPEEPLVDTARLIVPFPPLT
eukprot:CAMPEP_0171099276 /NCGR_PEP_ID=MMETSP0766_2-20121228/51009_1 /TAXON_ID=439317 /ORGANISM="Gambierdiscus australes, Strain CAWD 149" /LENGTH=236 /DNA_ID=CAMNT_0011558857 /DNA_START=72 /DNA_END=779 /DNA_ORIENTATION=+